MGIFDFFKSDIENSEQLKNRRISVFVRLFLMHPNVYPDLMKNELNITIDSEVQKEFEKEIFFIVYRFFSDLIIKDPEMNKYMHGEMVKSIAVESYSQSKLFEKESFLSYLTKKESEYSKFDPPFVNDDLIKNFAKVSSRLIGSNNHERIQNLIIEDYKEIFKKMMELHNICWDDPRKFLEFTND